MQYLALIYEDESRLPMGSPNPSLPNTALSARRTRVLLKAETLCSPPELPEPFGCATPRCSPPMVLSPRPRNSLVATI